MHVCRHEKKREIANEKFKVVNTNNSLINNNFNSLSSKLTTEKNITLKILTIFKNFNFF